MYYATGEQRTSGANTYQFDAEGRLTRVTGPGGELARFVYDGLGRRVQKVAGGTTWTYIYDGAEIVEERASTGTTLRFVHGPGIDQHLAQYVSTAPGSPTYLLADHLGSIWQQTSTAGSVTFTRQYDPWGNLLAGQSAGRYAFTGREWDNQIGLYYYRARYYDPKIGRFLSEDQSYWAGSYQYAGQSPIGKKDPTGYVTVNAGSPTFNWLPVQTVANVCGGHFACTDSKADIFWECKKKAGCYAAEFTINLKVAVWLPNNVLRPQVFLQHELGHVQTSMTWLDQVVADAATMESYRFCTEAQCQRAAWWFSRLWLWKLVLRQVSQL